MAWPEKLWRWGVILPATLAAVAGVVADVVTGTLFYWPLLAPSYVTVAIATWRSLDSRARARWLDQRLADLEAEAKAAGDPPLPSLEPDDEPIAEDTLVTEPPRLSVGRMVGSLGEGFVRLLGTVVIAFMYLVAIQGVITFATWARPYWYVYGPALALIALLVWLMFRTGGAPKAGGGDGPVTTPGRRAPRADDARLR